MDKEMLKQILEEEIEDCKYAIKDCDNEIEFLQTIIDLENQTKLSAQDLFRTQRLSYVLKGALAGEIAGFGAEAANLLAKVVANSDQTPVPPVASFASLIGVGIVAGYLNYRLKHKKQLTEKRDQEVALMDEKIKENEEAIEFYKQKKLKVSRQLEDKISEKKALEEKEQAEAFER